MLCALSLFLSLDAHAGPAQPFSLQIIQVKTEKLLYECLLAAGDRFYLDYIHSSAKTPVQDIFTVSAQGEIILLEENFLWFGAGLEASNTEDVKVVYDREQKKIRVLQQRRFPHFLLRIGRIANQRLTCRTETIPLNRLAQGGESVHIRIISRKH